MKISSGGHKTRSCSVVVVGLLVSSRTSSRSVGITAYNVNPASVSDSAPQNWQKEIFSRRVFVATEPSCSSGLTILLSSRLLLALLTILSSLFLTARLLLTPGGLLSVAAWIKGTSGRIAKIGVWFGTGEKKLTSRCLGFHLFLRFHWSSKRDYQYMQK